MRPLPAVALRLDGQIQLVGECQPRQAQIHPLRLVEGERAPVRRDGRVAFEAHQRVGDRVRSPRGGVAVGVPGEGLAGGQARQVVVRELYASKEALDEAMASGATSCWDEQFDQLDEVIVTADGQA